jgi:hypothetical protein
VRSEDHVGDGGRLGPGHERRRAAGHGAVGAGCGRVGAGGSSACSP